ncbi:O-antigen ligase [Cohnella sp. REN36]|uniref:O-antigen ligase family protein n=1 Tax=Cohnella sp. REN36 TaxID=2887347 RepID=UPI001D15DD1B|nr:O-antigen ligase family protein [Cohnella sp. REN36]MCC3375997.1 O-antigen ligase family protein [Cohnella sp. REN36]
MLIRLIICLVIMGITIWRSEAGLAASIQAFLIKSAFEPPDYSYGPKEVVQDNDLISVIIPLIVFAIILFKKLRKNETYSFKFIDLAFIAMGGILLIGSLYSPLQGKALMVTAKYYSLGISFYFIARLYLSKHPHYQIALRNFLNMTWLIALVLGLFAFIQSWGMEYARLKLGAAVPIPFSLLLAIGVLINFSWFLFHKSSFWLRVLQIISFGTLLFIFIDTNTRGTIIALGISIIFLSAIYMINHKQWGKVMLFIPLLVLGVLIINYINPDLTKRVTSNLELITSHDQGESINNRQSAYSDAWKLFNDNPYLGVGTGDFEEHSQLAYPHNVFLEIMAENGIVGMICLVALYIATIAYILKICAYRSPITYVIAAVVLLNLIEMQFSFTLWMHKSFYLFCGVLVSSYYQVQRVARSEKKSVAPMRSSSRFISTSPVKMR